MRDYRGSLPYKGHIYRLVFNLNVMEEIQEAYGTVDKWGELTDRDEPDAKALKVGIRAMLNEGIEIENEENGTNLPLFSLKQIGRVLSEIGTDVAAGAMRDTVIESVKSDEKNE